MGVTLAEADRTRGLIYLDQSLADAAATHALIIGCGRFVAASLPPVTSPPVSARKMAGWFLDQALARNAAGFANAARPLGSVAVLLSEAADGALSQIEGGPVPRATFDAVKQAVRDWAARAERHKDAMMVLFMASHGQSFNRQTAILCEDYGADAGDEFAGMTEVEQFVEAVANLDVAEKLLIFDCCRAPGALPQNPAGLYGSRLMAKKPALGGTPRRPQVLRSTVLGKEAYGLPDSPTLFTQALLEALGGLAADYNAGWQIASDDLATVTGNLLGLHRLEAEQLQEPEFQLTAAFAVAQGAGTDRATVYVALDAPLDSVTGQLTLTCDGQVQSGALPVQPPFLRFDVPGGKAFAVQVRDAGGGVLAETAPFTPQLPLLIRHVPYRSGIQVLRSKSLAMAAGPTSLTLNVGADARGVVRISDAAGVGHSLSLASGVQALALAPGTHRVVFAGLDGRVLTTEVEVGNGEDIALDLGEAARVSPREWLLDAVRAGVIRADARPGTGVIGAVPAVRAIGGAAVAAVVAGGAAAAEVGLTLSNVAGDGRFYRYGIKDMAPERLRAQRHVGQTVAAGPDYPVWVIATAAGWREAGFLPELGQQGRWLETPDRQPDPWVANLLIDLEADNAARLIAYVQNARWLALLAYLARRDFVSGGAEFAALLGNDVLRDAVIEKVANPLAALAAALIGVATGRVAAVGVAQDWLRNLANWFPGVPDGPVILARHLLAQGKTDEAAALLQAGYARGVPVYSLAVDWLAEGMVALELDGAEVARRWSRLVDPGRAFSVLRLPAEAKR